MAEQKSVGVYPPYFKTYISLVENEELVPILTTQAEEAATFFNSIPEEKWLYKYAENKWTIKEVLQHITDTERVFSFRALAFSRKDPNHFPPFNEMEYTKNSNANDRAPETLIEEFLVLRKSSQLLYANFSDEQLNQVGNASSSKTSVTAIGYMIAGHFAHHLKIINERYFEDRDK